jgi:hypothetical protein
MLQVMEYRVPMVEPLGRWKVALYLIEMSPFFLRCLIALLTGLLTSSSFSQAEKTLFAHD